MNSEPVFLKKFGKHQPAEVGSASHKSCAASALATTLKILRRKRFRKPQKNNCASSARESVTL